jgi:molybdopterin converting factor small subunit
MKVHLRVLLPVLPEAMGGKESQVEFSGDTVHDLIEHLIARYGRKARQALYDRNGQLDPVVQILLNGEQWVPHDQLDTVLHDGDDVMLALMLAGG